MNRFISIIFFISFAILFDHQVSALCHALGPTWGTFQQRAELDKILPEVCRQLSGIYLPESSSSRCIKSNITSYRRYDFYWKNTMKEARVLDYNECIKFIKSDIRFCPRGATNHRSPDWYWISDPEDGDCD
ncbi:secreted protein [Melampsora americana]|nr:secreted protein [Melampsora americana]